MTVLNEKVLGVLELPKVLERLAEQTSFSASRELALALRPAVEPGEVAHRQRLTTEARRLLDLKPTIGIGGARDVRPAVQRATLGGILEPQELLDVRETLASARAIKSGVVRLADDVPALADLAQIVVDRPSLEAEIGRCIGERGDVLDSASPALARIRSELKLAHQRLLEKLNDILTSTTYRPVLQEALVTVREGRYVVPLKAEAKGQLRGIIHDQSASGATLFVEPLITVDLNNRWRQLQIEEQHEVERILRELSRSVAANATEIYGNVVALAEIDLALAKAKYAIALKAVEPALATGREKPADRSICLRQARHPLLSGHVVPIDVHLGDDFAVLVVTGPNTGGKTVALKTVGLLTLMAQAGLHIPAAEESRVRIFRGIYADIGDEQSIEQSLSTFSSHMTHIVEIVQHVDAESLVLLDEIGAGTDPTEGSALARAILSHLLAWGAWVVATTHYSELKAYAHNTPGVQNASVEFDVETLAPTYRLSIGLPGRSNALAIASRLGLPEALTQAARDLVSPEEQQVETLLAGIQAERDRAAAERQAAQRERRHSEEIRRVLTRRLENVEAQRQEVLAQARQEAREELAEVREKLRRAAADLERATVTRETLLPVAQQLRQAERELAAKTPARLVRLAPELDGEVESGGELRLGDTVLVRSLSQSGELVGLPDERGQAEVQLGNFKLRVNLDDLERTKGRSRERAGSSSGSYSTVLMAERAVPMQLDMRGWRAEQVVPELDRYLDDAYLAGLPFVRIVHGKGAGVLRQVVRDFLAGHPLVRSYQTADAREGGEGVTVVSLGQ